MPSLMPLSVQQWLRAWALLAESGKEATSASAKRNEIEFCIQSNKDSRRQGRGRESVG